MQSVNSLRSGKDVSYSTYWFNSSWFMETLYTLHASDPAADSGLNNLLGLKVGFDWSTGLRLSIFSWDLKINIYLNVLKY